MFSVFALLFLSSPLSAISWILPGVGGQWQSMSNKQLERWTPKSTVRNQTTHRSDAFLPLSLPFCPVQAKDLGFSASALWWSEAGERGNRKQMGLDLITPGVHCQNTNLIYSPVTWNVIFQDVELNWGGSGGFSGAVFLKRGPEKALQPSVCMIARKVAVFHSPKAGFVLARFRVPGKAPVWPSCPEGGESSFNKPWEGTRLISRKPCAWPLWESLLSSYFLLLSAVQIGDLFQKAGRGGSWNHRNLAVEMSLESLILTAEQSFFLPLCFSPLSEQWQNAEIALLVFIIL